LPFFKLLKKSSKFEWTKGVDEAFQKLKEYLSTSPILSPPKKQEPHLLYIAATTTVVNVAIVVEHVEEGNAYNVQLPIYYISEVLLDSKARYPHEQKLLYALLITSCKLCHYFDEHKVIVVSDFPLGDVLRNHDAIGHISKWSIKLRVINIKFASRKATKSQVLANFIVEWTEIQQPTLTVILDHWKIYFDGSLKLGGADASVLFISPDGKQLKYVLQIL
jgi:hypothetical protein